MMFRSRATPEDCLHIGLAEQVLLQETVDGLGNRSFFVVAALGLNLGQTVRCELQPDRPNDAASQGET